MAKQKSKGGASSPSIDTTSSSSRGKLSVAFFIIVGVLVVLEAVILTENPLSLKDQINQKLGDIQTFKKDYPLVVLYKGRSSKQSGEWSTAYWAGWGHQNRNLKGAHSKLFLPWAAEGTFLSKSCNVSCYVTADQELLQFADVVVMEIINHKKSFGKHPVEWPTRGVTLDKKRQEWGMFYYEAPGQYSDFLSENLVSNFDFTVTPHQDSTLPVTLICLWGRRKATYLTIPPKKNHVIADFTPYIPQSVKPYFQEFRTHIHVDSFAGPFKNAEPTTPFKLPERIDHMAKYKFVIIVEAFFERDWVGPEFSQVLLAGAIPVYMGATNIEEFLPGEHSIINVADFESPKDLADLINELNTDDAKYQEYFAWKKNGLSPSFETHLENCVHQAECRICNYILEKHKNIQ